MSVTPFSQWLCPLDRHALEQHGNSWRCENGHSFDIGKGGYLNLLPVQSKRSKDPGDSKAMVAARRRFLEAGYYQAIAVKMAELIQAHLTPDSQRINCLDAGCGEGYYLRQLGQALTHHDISAVGTDISKWAIQAAAKRDSSCGWLVASNADLPLPSSNLDIVLCLFGFPVYGEFHRTMKPKGLYVQVDAGPLHLQEMRNIIYDKMMSSEPTERQCPAGFTLIEQARLTDHTLIQGKEAIADLLLMTPHYFRATQQGKAILAELQDLAVTIDVEYTLFQRLD